MMRLHISTQYASIDDYIADTHMDSNGSWGTEVEIIALAHLLDADIFSFQVSRRRWNRFNHSLLTMMESDHSEMALYMNHPRDHFEVVTSISPPLPEAPVSDLLNIIIIISFIDSK